MSAGVTGPAHGTRAGPVAAPLTPRECHERRHGKDSVKSPTPPVDPAPHIMFRWMSQTAIEDGE